MIYESYDAFLITLERGNVEWSEFHSAAKPRDEIKMWSAGCHGMAQGYLNIRPLYKKPSGRFDRLHHTTLRLLDYRPFISWLIWAECPADLIEAAYQRVQVRIAERHL